MTSVRFTPAHAADDGKLAAAAQRGDQSAFGELYERYARVVHGLLLARVPRADVDDLVQDVFLTAWNRLAGLREPAAFGGWLAMIARNRAIDFHRHAADSVELPADLAAHDDTAARADAARLLDDCPHAARGLPRNAGAAAGRRHDRTGDRRAHRPDRGVGAREPPPRHEAAARADRTMTDHEPDAPSDYLWDGTGVPTRRSCASRKRSGRCAIKGRCRRCRTARPAGAACAGYQRRGWPPPRRWCCWSEDGSITLLLRRRGLEREQPFWRTRGRRPGGDHPGADEPRRLAGHRQRVARQGRGRAASAPSTSSRTRRLQLVANDRVHRMALEPRHHPCADLGAAEAVRRQHRGGDGDRSRLRLHAPDGRATTACCA